MALTVYGLKIGLSLGACFCWILCWSGIGFLKNRIKVHGFGIGIQMKNLVCPHAPRKKRFSFLWPERPLNPSLNPEPFGNRQLFVPNPISLNSAIKKVCYLGSR